MDTLDSLPTDQTELDPNQRAVMQTFVAAPPKGKAFPGQPESPSKWKMIGYIIIVFIVLANPILQMMANGLPYVGDSGLLKFAATTVLFIVAVCTISYFA